VFALLSALSKVFKTTVQLIDQTLQNWNITLCIDALVFSILTGMYVDREYAYNFLDLLAAGTTSSSS